MVNLSHANESQRANQQALPESAEFSRGLPNKGDRHFLVFQPMSSSKAVRLLVDDLLRIENRSPDDVGTERGLSAITSSIRRSVSNVRVINSFGPTGTDISAFKPLARLDPEAPTFIDDVLRISEALIADGDGQATELCRSIVARLIICEAKRTSSIATGARGRFSVPRLISQQFYQTPSRGRRRRPARPGEKNPSPPQP